ncbi:phage tail tube protein [Acinetobacter puyangensis]|uniref:phage tail tube protein n=1 Tax=Acinetobacter puyangensis TaxID=1096779 RepID=UPI003A4E28DB
MAVIKVAGTNVYAFDGTAVTKLICTTGIDLGSDSTSRIENTCLEETQSRSYLNGLSDPAEGSLTFNLDPANTTHLKLIEWAEDKKEGIQFYVGASDGTADITATGTTAVVPETRSWWSFIGGISTPVPSFDLDALVGYTVTLQRSTSVAFTPKTTP